MASRKPFESRLEQIADVRQERHPLLAQVPLTVSPFISLPSAPTLPYTYKPLPSTLPPSSTADGQGVERERYVVAPSGHTAHPDEILASCQTLQEHISKVQEDAEKTLTAWQDDLRAQDLADKRKVAPGWLDREEKILKPKRLSAMPQEEGLSGQSAEGSLLDQPSGALHPADQDTRDAAGQELDRAFGGMSVRSH